MTSRNRLPSPVEVASVLSFFQVTVYTQPYTLIDTRIKDRSLVLMDNAFWTGFSTLLRITVNPPFYWLNFGATYSLWDCHPTCHTNRWVWNMNMKENSFFAFPKTKPKPKVESLLNDLQTFLFLTRNYLNSELLAAIS